MTVPVVATIIERRGFCLAANYTGRLNRRNAIAQAELGRFVVAKGVLFAITTPTWRVSPRFCGFQSGPDLPSGDHVGPEPALLHTWLKDPTAIKPDADA
jgi:hypothetical protein